ncbi:COG0863 DNA modification methylase [uncultured Caudovirales phage]|uniref:site-specific DNA-methyltransferase (cytosine-N(4)-specific) n=1 Tax=uncultured Caudovirales phage TaxID=2100421 RepID=A0A6J5LVG1_9CAUD|nr:COG0863 DNA modification methylase [uncultured Caudovirales phage]
MTVRILQGDVREALAVLPEASVHCVVTSPPYYGLRDYGVDGQIGLEETPDAYVAELVQVFREVWRVLHPSGVVWLNLGDSYATRWSSVRSEGRAGLGQQERARTGAPPAGYKNKDLLGIPWRVAFALQADGWWLRRDVIWDKPACMPESVKDRPTTSHEYLFLLTKGEDYHYDWLAIAEPVAASSVERLSQDVANQVGTQRANGGTRAARPLRARGGAGGTVRNARSVWHIPTQPFKEAHFATMPPELAERGILAGTSPVGCCPHCLAPWEREAERLEEAELDVLRAAGADENGEYHGTSTKNHAAAGVQDASKVKASVLKSMRPLETVAWHMTCDCPIARPTPCTVLDPFGGAGTTGLVADRLQRHAVLVELNPKYADMARDRINAEDPLRSPARVEVATQQPSEAA